jgi:hypothetical protein
MCNRYLCIIRLCKEVVDFATIRYENFQFMISNLKEDGMDFNRIKEYLTNTLQDLKERAELIEGSATHNPHTFKRILDWWYSHRRI